MTRDLLRSRRAQYAARSMRRSLPAGFCAAPFTQMFIYPTGEVFVCCEGGGYLGTLKEHTLEELWNGPNARRLRAEFLSGNPVQCRTKIEERGCHESNDDKLFGAELTEVQSRPPAALDMIVNGRCNLDCIMCEVKDKRQNVMDIPNFKSEIAAKVFPGVKKISVKSGEPFLQRETFELIRQVTEVNRDCAWSFTTNGQYRFDERLKEPLGKIAIERIVFSVDSVDDAVFAQIRKPGSLRKCLDAIAGIREWGREKEQPFPIELSVNVTFQKRNWRDVPEVMRHFAAEGIRADIIFVEKPEDCSLVTAGEEEIVAMLRHYLTLGTEYDAHLPALSRALAPVYRAFPGTVVQKLKLMLEMRMVDFKSRQRELCPFPFTQMALFHDGSLRPCCWLPKVDFRENGGGDFKAAWNGTVIRGLRREHLNGDLATCGDKMKKLSCHATHRNLQTLVRPEEVQDLPMMRLDWFFSGKCNLKCPSCNNWQYDEEFPEGEEYWERLKTDVLPWLCEIDVKGGEPFIQKRTFALMKFMAEHNPACVWEITTNGQVALNTTITSLLDGLLLGHFAVSIDSLQPERFARLRLGGELSRTLEFLDRLRLYNRARPAGRGFQIVVNFVLQKENWRELADIVRFTMDREVILYVIPMSDPHLLSIHAMPLEERRLLQAEVSRLAGEFRLDTLRQLEAALKDCWP